MTSQLHANRDFLLKTNTVPAKEFENWTLKKVQMQLNKEPHSIQVDFRTICKPMCNNYHCNLMLSLSHFRRKASHIWRTCVKNGLNSGRNVTKGLKSGVNTPDHILFLFELDFCWYILEMTPTSNRSKLSMLQTAYYFYKGITTFRLLV